MDLKRKIMFIVPSMRGGGSERVMSILLKHLNQEKFDIILVLIKKEGKYLADIPNDVKVIDLNKKNARSSIFKIVHLIRKHNPDIVISTLGYLNLLVSITIPFLSNDIKFIARESSIVSHSAQNQKYPAFFFNILYKMFYNNFDLIICQSQYMKNDLMKNYGILEDKSIVINNPVDIDNIEMMSQEGDKDELFNKEKINLLAVGRLHEVKCYDLLIETLSKLDNKFHLTILGEGEEEKRLKELGKTFNVNEKVTFLGFQQNPYKYMKQADLFILSSKYEGFPNVVLEANACGTPVIAFDCPGGVGEIIQHKVNGCLVENGNVGQLAKIIIEYSNYSFNKKNISNLISLKYNVISIVKKYEDALLNP